MFFSLPVKVNSENQIQLIKECNSVEFNDLYIQEAYNFGRHIQNLITNKDIEGIFQVVLSKELINGPRRDYALNKSFDEIFPQEWVDKIINSEISCEPVGWRGFMISNGLIWYDKTNDGNWTIISINGVNQESFNNAELIGWQTDKGIIPPSCFPIFGYFEQKINYFTQKFGIKDRDLFKYNPGQFIGETIPLNHSLNFTTDNDNLYAITIHLDQCFNWNLENGFAHSYERNSDLIIFDNVIYQSKNIGGEIIKDEYKTHYEVLSKIELSLCDELALQLRRKCTDSYLIKIGSKSGGTIGWLGSYYILGIFEDEDKNQYLVPLKRFDNRNLALDFLKDLD